MGGGETRADAISYAVQMYALKGEDKFVAVPDVYGETGNLPPSARRAKAKRDARAAGAASAAGAEDEEDFDAARSGDFLSCFAVFDGHVNATASSHCERFVLDELLRCGADAADAPLESACVSAFERVERSYKSAGSCFPSIFACLPASRGGSSGVTREGGTTASVVCVQRRRPGANGEPRVDVVAANAGDSGSLLVHFKDPIVGQPSSSPRLTAEMRRSIDEDAATAPDMPDFRRLTRDHNPDDPFEARRLVDAGARLGRMRQGGEEVGPMRTYPGGLAVSRAIGDLNAPAVICKPECTRVPVPPAGGRLVLASDGLWNALGDGEAATIAHEAESAEAAAASLVRAVMQRRGAHDDITIVVVDIPPPKKVIKWAAARRAHPEPPGTGEGTSEEGGDTPSPLAAKLRARRSVDQLVRDARRRSLDRGAEPPPEWAETREDQARANRGRKFDVQADVTVRRGLDAAFVRAAPRDGASADAENAEKEKRPASRPVNAGCLACLLGGGVDHSALADVDDADAEEGASLRDDYVLGAVLGRGMYGSVRLAYLKAGRRGSRDGASEGLASSAGSVADGASGSAEASPLHPSAFVEARAVKSIATDGSKRSAERVRDEVDAMYAVSGRHPNLPTVFASYEQKTVGPVGGTFVQVVHIVTEAYTGGDLVTAIARRGSLLARDWEAIAAQLLGAAAFLHAVGVVHRDIKPENVMLKRPWLKGAEPSAVLVDFGGAAFARGKTRELVGFVGTKFFGAPECFKHGSRHGAKSDVWSIGVTLLTILAGTPPAFELGTAWRALHAGEIPAILKPPAATPRRFKRLIESLLTVEPEDRPSAAEALSGAPWLLGYAPSQRKRDEGSGADGAKKTRENVPFARPEKALVASPEDEDSGSGRGGFVDQTASTRLDGEEELANVSDVVANATTNAARADFSRAAAFILSVCLDAAAIDALVAELRPGASPAGRKSFDAQGGADGVASNAAAEAAPLADDDTVPALTLERALWATGAKEAAMQLELLRAQTTNAAVAELGARREAGVGPAPAGSTQADRSVTPEQKAALLKADRDLVERALGVEFRRMTTLADLHARHARVYEAVVVAKSDKSRVGRLTNAFGGRRETGVATFQPATVEKPHTERLNEGDSLHGGMLMAMLARQSGRSNNSPSFGRGDSGSGSGSVRHKYISNFPSPAAGKSRGDDSDSGGTPEDSSRGVSSRDIELAPFAKPMVGVLSRLQPSAEAGEPGASLKRSPSWWQEETVEEEAEEMTSAERNAGDDANA